MSIDQLLLVAALILFIVAGVSKDTRWTSFGLGCWVLTIII